MENWNTDWDDEEWENEDAEEIPCDRCGRTFPKNALQAYEDYDHCCWDCSCHLEDPIGYPFDPKDVNLKMKEFLVIKCLNCGLYLVDNDEDSQIDCPFCGYSNELTDIRIEWWEVEEKN
jgi:hypothetical protein